MNPPCNDIIEYIINPYIHSNNHYYKFKRCLEVIKHPDMLNAFKTIRKNFTRECKIFIYKPQDTVPPYQLGVKYRHAFINPGKKYKDIARERLNIEFMYSYAYYDGWWCTNPRATSISQIKPNSHLYHAIFDR